MSYKFSFEETAKLFSKVAIYHFNHQQCMRHSVWLHSCQHLALSLFILGCPNRCVVIANHGFHLHFSDSDVKHLFMCLFAIYIFQ